MLKRLVEITGQPGGAKTLRLALRGAPAPVLTLAAYGYMAELCRQAALSLAYDHEVFVELITPELLSPFDSAPLLASLRKTGRLLTVEEGSLTSGWGAEVAAQCAEAIGPALRQTRRLGGRDFPIPASVTLEEAILPGVDDILRLACAMVKNR